MSDRPLLLHSLREFRSLILPCIEAVQPRRVVEIGGEGGLFTRELCEWARDHGASVTCIEPFPVDAHRQLVASHGLELVEGKSPAALEDLEPFDVYVVDGDHNYHVVAGELGHAFADGRGPLAIAHDVAWPCARRDQYYAPEDVPDAARQPYSYDSGVRPEDPGLAERGFRGAGAFAYAQHEGGPHNGVLTAVEDVVAERGDLELLRVPCIFGLGFVFPSDTRWADAVRGVVAPFHENEVLAALEANRIDLFLRVIDPFAGDFDRGRDSLIASLQREIEDLQTEVARLRLAAAPAPSAS